MTYTSNSSQDTAVGPPTHDEAGSSLPANASGGSGIPKGAMASRIPSGIQPVPYTPAAQTPPGTPSPTQALLTPNRVQFASYRSEFDDDEKRRAMGDAGDELPPDYGWTPMPLKTWFWISFIITMILMAVGLEIALHFNRKSNGWTPLKSSVNQGAAHYIYTLPPVIVAMFFAAMWAWTDIEIKKMQPYVDLVHGDSPPERSLLLDYTRHNNFVVWTRAAHNKHYLVALTSLMTILVLAFSPLAAALLSVRPTWWAEPDTSVINSATLGAFRSEQFNDLTAFVTASGFSSASVLYNLNEPPFIYREYTVAPFEVPTHIATNGTVYARTSAVKSEPNCQLAQTDRVKVPELTRGWNNSATFQGCTYNWTLSDEVNRNSINLFGSDLFSCGSTEKEENQPVVFWFFTYRPEIRLSATVCQPKLSFWDVDVQLDIASGNITSVKELQPFEQGGSQFTSTASTLNDLQGKAHNGVGFTLNEPDRFMLARVNATRLQLPASVFQKASQGPGGFFGAFDAGTYPELSNDIYGTYLKVIARSLYFVPTTASTQGSDRNIMLQIWSTRQRLFMSDVAVHLLAAAMFILALFGTIIHLFHRLDRFDLNLTHAPGTIASAVSIGGDTGMGHLLAHSRKEEDIALALKDRKFRIDPVTQKIVMQGEESYENARSPDHRRSVFGTTKSRPSSRRFSKPAAPKSPVGLTTEEV